MGRGVVQMSGGKVDPKIELKQFFVENNYDPKLVALAYLSGPEFNAHALEDLFYLDEETWEKIRQPSILGNLPTRRLRALLEKIKPDNLVDLKHYLTDPSHKYHERGVAAYKVLSSNKFGASTLDDLHRMTEEDWTILSLPEWLGVLPTRRLRSELKDRNRPPQTTNARLRIGALGTAAMSFKGDIPQSMIDAAKAVQLAALKTPNNEAKELARALAEFAMQGVEVTADAVGMAALRVQVRTRFSVLLLPPRFR